MSLSVQFLSLLAMIGTGIIAAAFIDMIVTGTAHSGKKSLVKKYATILEVIGWIIAGLGAFYVLYIVRDGAWRIYDPFAQLSGIYLYASIFHKPFRLVGNIILYVVIKPLLFIIQGIISIISFLIHIIWRVLSFLSLPIVKIFRKLNGKFFKNNKK